MSYLLDIGIRAVVHVVVLHAYDWRLSGSWPRGNLGEIKMTTIESQCG